MNLTQRAAFVRQTLDAYFPEVFPPLQHTDPYTLLIAVLLSARCTDARVNTVTPTLFALASTPAAMAALDPAVIRDVIRTCGLSANKAAAISQLSSLLCQQHGGQVPCDWQALEALPGVGHKTASVVMSQAFDIPAFPVDTHIYRSAHRWHLSEERSIARVERDLKALYPPDSWNKLHLQIIYFARAYCRALQHDIRACPICSQLKV